MDHPPAPPPRADALLARVLPEGVLGLTIIGDLHEEFHDLVQAGALRSPDLWYWRAALGLGARYAFVRLRRRLLVRPEGGSIGEELMTTFLADLRYGMRMLWKTPLQSLIAVLTIALGVGLTVHTFSSVYGSVVRGVPLDGRERLVSVFGHILERGIQSTDRPIHDYLDVREQQTSFEDLAAYYQGTVNVAGDEGPPERFAGAFMTANGLEVTRVPPILGRTFRPGEDAADASPVIVLGHHVWQNRFAGDPDIVGTTIRVNGETSTVIGVMPEGFRFPFLEDVWVPHRIDVANLPRGEGPYVSFFGRLREGVSMDVARTELAGIAGRIASDFPETNEGVGFGVQPYEERFMPAEIRAVLWVMMAAVFGVLLVACANVANLLLARASVRTREVAIRTALGAGRFRVIRQLLLESFALALIGGAIGVVLAQWGIEVYSAALADIYKPYWIDIRMGAPVLVFAVGVTVVAALVAGTVPALRASGVGVGEILKDESRGSSGLRLGRFSTGLVIGEIAVTCGVLVAAGLMVKSIINLRTLDMGFETAGVMTGRVGLFEADYPDPESRDQFFRDLEERLEAEPGVTSAALAGWLPGLGAARWRVAIDGETYATDRDQPVVNGGAVTPDFFRTFGVDFVQGRDFTLQEARRGGEAAAIVNRSFVARYLPDGDVLGRRIKLGSPDSQNPWMTIVGVVPDLHVGGGVGGIGDDRISPEQIYLAPALYDFRFLSVAVRTQGPPTAMAGRIRQIVAELDPNLPVYQLASMDDAIRQSTWAFGMFGSLFTIFGIVALFMSAVGLYGVMSFSVAQRRREVGIRMALGAEAGDILRMVLRKGTMQLGIGLLLGVGIGLAASQPLRTVLFGVEAGDPVVYASILATLAATGLVACFVPARAATLTDPIEAMRLE